MRRVVARAPVRIDFGGGWTDVPPYDVERGGCVCNLAISRHAVVELVETTSEPTVDESSGPLAIAALRRAGVRDASVTSRSNFPVGAGLGGSSAAGVALAGALAAWRDDGVSRSELAERSRAVEVEELGVPGGRQDHYAAAFGGALGLWFSGDVTVRRIPISDDAVRAIERQCTVVYTGQSRISGETITAVLDAYRASNPRVVEALGRMVTLAEGMVAALEAGDIAELGALVDEHWVHQSALHERISTPEIERVLREAKAAGAYGGKALGASGGGCVVVISPEERAARVRHTVAAVAQLLPFAVDRDGVTMLVEE